MDAPSRAHLSAQRRSKSTIFVRIDVAVVPKPCPGQVTLDGIGAGGVASTSIRLESPTAHLCRDHAQPSALVLGRVCWQLLIPSAIHTGSIADFLRVSNCGPASLGHLQSIHAKRLGLCLCAGSERICGRSSRTRVALPQIRDGTAGVRLLHRAPRTAALQWAAFGAWACSRSRR